MIYLLNMMIFHGYVSHNQRVIVSFNGTKIGPGTSINFLWATASMCKPTIALMIITNMDLNDGTNVEHTKTIIYVKPPTNPFASNIRSMFPSLSSYFATLIQLDHSNALKYRYSISN